MIVRLRNRHRFRNRHWISELDLNTFSATDEHRCPQIDEGILIASGDGEYILETTEHTEVTEKKEKRMATKNCG